MEDLQHRIEKAQELLSSSAVPIAGTLGREHEEAPDGTRFPFQRDRDRIIHSRAFRRLKGKTQVFVAGEGDHYRTRLTHTMEVAQISRDMARTLGLNEDLAECIALAHDLGHPPFGHAGEDALDAWMQQHEERFEHNKQSLRIVTELEAHSALYTGLNLNREVLDGLMKHRTPYDDGALGPLSLEAQVVNLADEIAYTGHDCDDGLRSGLLSEDALGSIPLIEKANTKRKERGTSLRGALIDLLVSDLYATFDPQVPLRLSPETENVLRALRTFLWDHLYMHPQVLQKTEEGKRIITTLCNTLYETPNDKVQKLMDMHGSEKHIAIKDYVAGMTDSFARMNTEQ